MASRVLGLVRDQVLSYYFGASDAMDAYRVGFRFPNLFRDLFAEGAMSAAFVPTFTRHLAESGPQSAWRLANLMITALVVMFLWGRVRPWLRPLLALYPLAMGLTLIATGSIALLSFVFPGLEEGWLDPGDPRAARGGTEE